MRIRDAVRDVVAETIEAELEEALGAVRYGRSEERVGWRNGAKSRRVITSAGGIVLDVPRARIAERGKTREWTSRVLPRYARRTRRRPDGARRMYLGGVNTRKVKAVLRPLLGEEGLPKSSVSRVVARLARRRAVVEAAAREGRSSCSSSTASASTCGSARRSAACRCSR
jgi:transposase-like protein